MEESVRTEWIKENKPLRVEIEGLSTPLFLSSKVFKTGSVGFYLSSKCVMCDTPMQLSVCLTVIGSKRPFPPEGVNKETPYSEGFRHAQDIREAAEVHTKASNGKQTRPKRP